MWLNSISVTWLWASFMILGIWSWRYPWLWIFSCRFMKNHESKNSLLIVTIQQPRDGYFKWWKVNLEVSLAFFHIEESQSERELILSMTVSEQCLWGQQQYTYREGFLSYLQVKEGNNFIIGLTSKKQYQRLEFRQLPKWVKPSGFVICGTALWKPDFQKHIVPVSELRLRTHKLAGPSEVLCTYYLLLGQNLWKSVCNCMKPQHLHLQTIQPIIFSPSYAHANEKKYYLYRNYLIHVIHIYWCSIL